MYLEPHSKFSFRWILNELNYGALQKDERIEQIINHLKQDIRSNIQIDVFYGSIYTTIKSKYRQEQEISIQIKWVVNVFSSDYALTFLSDAYVQQNDDTSFRIVLNVNHPNSMSVDLFLKRVFDFFESDESSRVLGHEIKHMLDKIDGLFTKKETYTPKNNSFKEFSKYLSQNKEIDAHLLSVLLDLKRIRQSYPDISYPKAILLSKEYGKFVKYVSPYKSKKYKQKIIYFWSEISKGYS